LLELIRALLLAIKKSHTAVLQPVCFYATSLLQQTGVPCIGKDREKLLLKGAEQ
jgi:hypothetical protein